MFLKYLKILNCDGLIRHIDFHMGLNLIVDETPEQAEATGNNVGKTTLLRLIDYCLGGDPKKIYTTDVENKEVRRFLKQTSVELELCLTDSLLIPDSRCVTIRRDFAGGKKAVTEINGRHVDKEDFVRELQPAMWDEVTERPTFRQIISHSFRIDDQRLSHVLKTTGEYTTKAEYEALHFYLFGIHIEDNQRKVDLSAAIKADRDFKRQLERNMPMNVLRDKLEAVNSQIDTLSEQKNAYRPNPDFEQDLELLATVKTELSREAARLGNLQIRKNLVEEAARELHRMKSDANEEQIAAIYRQAKAFNPNLHRTFEELLRFHNGMLTNKADFIEAELPDLEKEIYACKNGIAAYRSHEKSLSKKLRLSTTFENFNRLIANLGIKYEEKGALEQKIELIEEVERRIIDNENELKAINNGLFSAEGKAYVQEQVDKFNVFFTSISQKLYNERHSIVVGETTYNGNPCYQFKPDSSDSFSTGKKQGEITCFDLAYVTFADEEDIPCLHFILNDKKELMHDNQLLGTARLVEEQGNVQYVASILWDKLPEELRDNKYIAQKLSMNDRLFRF